MTDHAALPSDDPFDTLVLADGAAHATVAVAHARRLCAGHFPGNPLLPGAYLAGLMADVAARLAGAPPIEIIRCVFIAPVRPESGIEVRATLANGLAQVEVWTAGRCGARAVIRLGVPA